jgi:Fis family transcriptional regulator, factor for inversion stimulation protein
MTLGQDLATVALAFSLNGVPLAEAERRFKRAFIEEVLCECRGNQLHAAKKLGVHRNTLSRDIAELGIDPSRFFGDEKRIGPPPRPAQRVLEFARRRTA